MKNITLEDLISIMADFEEVEIDFKGKTYETHINWVENEIGIEDGLAHLLSERVSMVHEDGYGRIIIELYS